MKEFLTTSTIIIVFVLSILIIFTVNNYETRKNEMEETLAVVLDQAMESLKFEEKEYTEENYRELVSDLLQQILFQMNSDGDVKINILTVDLEHGLIDVEVVQTYKWAGRDREVSERRTVILEEFRSSDSVEDILPDADETDKHVTVTFDADGVTSTLSVVYGEPIQKPADPEKTDWTFKGWYVKDDPAREVLDDSDWEDLCPSEDITFIAKFAAN